MPVEDGDAQKDEGEEEQEEALDEDSTDAESGSDESGESGDDGNGSDEEPSTPPPPIELPDRTTRGKRLRATLEDEEEDADNDFWKQDFFAEEGADGEYSADSNSEDSGDSDFSDAEEEDKDDDGTEEALRGLKLKKPKDKPPGHKQAALRKAAQARAKKQRDAKAAGETEQPAAPAKKEAKKVRFSAPAEPASAPSLRRSTKVRTAATISAEKQRAVSDAQRKPAARTKPKEAQAALRMVDVLQRAAADQLANQASLQALIAREADLKAKANQKASAARGPRIRWRYYTDLVPGPGGTSPADAAAAGPSTTAHGASESGAKEEKGEDEGEKCTRVGRCTFAFVEMTPDTVPPEYRRQTLNSVLRPPPDMCLKSDGSMQQRVRRLTPQEKAETAGEAAPGSGAARLSGPGSTSAASSIEQRVLGAVEGAISGKLRKQYGEMSRVVESVDGYQGNQATAAQHIAAMCVPDPMRGMHGCAVAGVGMQGQGGAHVGAMDLDMSMNGCDTALPGTSIAGMGGMDLSNVGGSMDTGWQNYSVTCQGLQSSGFSGGRDMRYAAPIDSSGLKNAGKGVKGNAKPSKGKGVKGGARSTNSHAAASVSQRSATARHSAPAAAFSHDMHAGHAHSLMYGSQGNMGCATGAAGLQDYQAGKVGSERMPQHPHCDGVGVPKSATDLRQLNYPLDMHPALYHAHRDAHARSGPADFGGFQMPLSSRSSVNPLGFAGYGKLDGSVAGGGGRAALAVGGFTGNGVRNGHHAPLGDINAGAGLSLDGAPLHPGQLPRNGFQHRPPSNGGRY